jgi:ribosomal protein S18 acetylase RimI-like enzyme
MENLNIRRAEAGDVPAIVGLWDEFMDFHSARDSRLRRAPDAEQAFAAFLEGRLRDPRAAVWVAELERTQVGYSLAVLSEAPPVFLDRWRGEICDLAVTARFRRQGIGEALLAATIDWFRERGVTRVELRVSASNEVASAFWEKQGFAPFSEILSRTL